jgi:hypothetical protein
VSEEPAFAPDRIVAALNAAGVCYIVVGGLAAGAHGVIRATRDLDLVPDGARQNMQALAQRLAALGAEHPVSGPLDADALARPVSFKLRTFYGDVQVLNRMPGVPPFARLHADRIVVQLAADAAVPICSLEHLRAMKRAAGRPRDLLDLAELAELHGP